MLHGVSVHPMQRYYSSTPFIHSQPPFVSRWGEELNSCVVPNSFKNPRQNYDVNYTPRSEMIWCGALWSLYTCSTNSLASVRAEGILGCGIKCTCLENMLVMTQITVFPELSGSSTLNSISFQDAWGFVTGCRRPGVYPGHPLAEEYKGQLVM